MREGTTASRVSPRELPINLNDRRAPIWWGMVGLIAIEATVFLALITSYFYLRFYAPEWPIGGIGRPDLLLPSIGTVILIASSAPVAWADGSSKRGEWRNVKIGLSAGLVLAAIFLILKYFEYSSNDYNWATNAYGSVVWAIIGFHSAHVIALALKTVVVLAATFRGLFSAGRSLGIQTNGLYWHFVVIVWIPLFFTLYLSHYIL